MRRFDVRKQLEGETLAVFEQSLRMLHREACPKTDIKSPEADLLLRRKFVDGILDLELQKYLRLHAARLLAARNDGSCQGEVRFLYQTRPLPVYAHALRFVWCTRFFLPPNVDCAS